MRSGAVFIAEITARAFIIADADKRRTLSRSDIAKAIGKSDQFDFLIDIIPREDVPSPKKKAKKEEDVRPLYVVRTPGAHAPTSAGHRRPTTKIVVQRRLDNRRRRHGARRGPGRGPLHRASAVV